MNGTNTGPMPTTDSHPGLRVPEHVCHEMYLSMQEERPVKHLLAIPSVHPSIPLVSDIPQNIRRDIHTDSLV